MSRKDKIILLPENVYNKIAAGEVVGRPASAVKELMENSVDAGARNVTVVVKEAGKRLIQVSDDGEGMSEKDALLSVKRHATSKIATAEDLEKIGTLGFRGEALSSIASVSQMVIKTNTDDEELGTIITIENGEARIEKESLPKGTTVMVKNLFYNVPARKNFLKSNQTEFRKIAETFNRVALAYPEISFTLYKDSSVYAEYKSGGLKERLASVFGERIIDMTIEFEEKTDFIAAFGFVAKPTFLTDSKNEQLLFVNGRYVKNRTVGNAVFAAYENIISKGEYPFFVLYLVIDTSMVDVNVHPSKEEIRFYDDSQIYSFVKAVVKKALGGYADLAKMKIAETESDKNLKVIVSNAKKEKKILRENHVYAKNEPVDDDELESLFGDIAKELNSGEKKVNAHPFGEGNGTENLKLPQTKESAKKMIFSAHKKYIVTQVKSGLMIININRAHRRILFEKAMTALREGVPFSQQLLFAQTFRLRGSDFDLLQKFDRKLTKLGFEIKYHAKQTISIVGVPADIKLGTETKTLLSILRALNEFGEGDTDKIIAETYSAEAAIKEGDELNENAMRLLVDQLFATKKPEFSPEGKRTFIKITLDKINELFEN